MIAGGVEGHGVVVVVVVVVEVVVVAVVVVAGEVAAGPPEAPAVGDAGEALDPVGDVLVEPDRCGDPVGVVDPAGVVVAPAGAVVVVFVVGVPAGRLAPAGAFWPPCTVEFARRRLGSSWRRVGAPPSCCWR
jgi:hypothetical protein